MGGDTMNIDDAIRTIQDGVEVKTIKEGIACNLACKVMDKFQVIRDILDECYEGYITDLEANKRIKDIVDEFDFMR